MDDEEFDELDGEEEVEEGSETFVSVDISGLSLYTHHGVSDAEQEVGQRLEVDIRLEIGECDAILTDRIDDTIDYGAVCETVSLIAHQRSYRTLERLAAVIADRLVSQYGADSVWIKITKPEPPLPLPTNGVSVELWHEA